MGERYVGGLRVERNQKSTFTSRNEISLNVEFNLDFSLRFQVSERYYWRIIWKGNIYIYICIVPIDSRYIKKSYSKYI